MDTIEFRERQLAHVERLNALVTQILMAGGNEIPPDTEDVTPEEAAAAFLLASAAYAAAPPAPVTELWPMLAASNLSTFQSALEGAKGAS